MLYEVITDIAKHRQGLEIFLRIKHQGGKQPLGMGPPHLMAEKAVNGIFIPTKGAMKIV